MVNKTEMSPQIELNGLPDNEKVILKTLLNRGELFRSDIVRMTGIKRTTVYDTLKKLIGKNLVAVSSINNHKPGRSKRLFYPTIPCAINYLAKEKFPPYKTPTFRCYICNIIKTIDQKAYMSNAKRCITCKTPKEALKIE